MWFHKFYKCLNIIVIPSRAFTVTQNSCFMITYSSSESFFHLQSCISSIVIHNTPESWKLLSPSVSSLLSFFVVKSQFLHFSSSCWISKISPVIIFITNKGAWWQIRRMILMYIYTFMLAKLYIMRSWSVQVDEFLKISFDFRAEIGWKLGSQLV